MAPSIVARRSRGKGSGNARSWPVQSRSSSRSYRIDSNSLVSRTSRLSNGTPVNVHGTKFLVYLFFLYPLILYCYNSRGNFDIRIHIENFIVKKMTVIKEGWLQGVKKYLYRCGFLSFLRNDSIFSVIYRISLEMNFYFPLK